MKPIIINRKRSPLKFAIIADWTIPESGSVSDFFVAIKLNDLEGKWIRLTAFDQMALLGAVIFGKREIMVTEFSTVKEVFTCGFGQDADVYEYTAARLKEKVNEHA